MKKTTITMLCLAACLAAADTKITWLADVTADRAETVTGVQSNQIRDAAAHINRADNPHSVTAPQIGALTVELDPVANAALVVHTNRTDNPHGVTAPQIGALTNELDLAALRTYHYGSPDIVESPAEWFIFDGAGTITAFNWAAGRTNVVIPWEIGGVPVTTIGDNAFLMSGIVSLIAPQTVTSIEFGAFVDCNSLASVSLPQVQTVGDGVFTYCYSLASVPLPQARAVGDYAFASCESLASIPLPQVQTVGFGAFESCTSLTSVYFDGNAPTIGTNIFENITANQVTIYVTNPTATGWGATLGGMPVVRLDLHGNLNGNATSATVVTGSQSNLIASAIQAESDPVAMAALTGYQSAAYWPPDATASSWFTFTTNANEITITGYNGGGTDVVIPDYINGLPVTEIGVAAFAESSVTSIGGAGNVVTVGDVAFIGCMSLTSVSLPQVQTVGDFAFGYCYSLTSIPLPQVQTVGDFAFSGCTSLPSLYFDNDVPTIGADIFAGITPNQVTNYVTNPQATGWGATFGGMPVVRLPLYADAIYQAGELVATTQYVAEQIAAIPPEDLTGRTATNLAVSGWLALPQTQQTNLIMRLVASNDVIMAIGVIQ